MRSSIIAMIVVLVVIVVFKIRAGHKMELWDILDEMEG